MNKHIKQLEAWIKRAETEEKEAGYRYKAAKAVVAALHHDAAWAYLSYGGIDIGDKVIVDFTDKPKTPAVLADVRNGEIVLRFYGKTGRLETRRQFYPWHTVKVITKFEGSA